MEMANDDPSSLNDISILSTDFVPNREMAERLRATIKAQEAEEELLDLEISQSDPATLCHLTNRRSSLRNSREVNESLLAPVRKLAPETLGEVFSNCIPFGKFSVEQAPLLLLKVCRRWRRVAIGTPGLWKDVDLEDWHGPNPSPILRMWLENSRSLPIDITVTSQNISEEWSAEVTRLIVSNLPRIRRLDCGFVEHFHEELLRLDLPVHATSLEYLRIDKAWSFPSASAIPPLKGCIHAPRLDTIALAGPAFMLDLITVNSFTLRHIVLGPVDGAMLPHLHILHSCQNLQILTVVITEGCYGLRPPVRFPSLREFYVECHNVCPSPFLQSCSVPVLEELCINQAVHGDPVLLWAALDSLLPGNHPIQELSLLSVPVVPLRFLLMLRRLTALHSLTLRVERVADAILQALTPAISAPGPSWMCPRLSTLDLGHSLSGDLLVQLVRIRTSVHQAQGMVSDADTFAGLVDVDVSDCKGIDANHREALAEIERACGGLVSINADADGDM